jgi:hypothetical protein
MSWQYTHAGVYLSTLIPILVLQLDKEMKLTGVSVAPRSRLRVYMFKIQIYFVWILAVKLFAGS